MNVKEQVLEILENGRGSFYSGEEIAGKLSVSRNAVWKAVKALQSEDYDISAVTNRGYCLSESTDIISESGIRKYLSSEAEHLRFDVCKTITSTNTEAKKLAAAGEAEGKVIISEEQTAGRGRLGRSFYSPSGTGIYMSIILRPKLSAENAIMLTTAAAVATAEAVEALSGRNALIKWVNDIFVDGKKVCGILTEAALDMEVGRLDYAVVGIGINAVKPCGSFPDEIKNSAGYVFDESGGNLRNKLAAEVLNRLCRYYSELDKKKYVRNYRERSFVIGRNVELINCGNVRNAVVLDVDDSCRLKVRLENGEETLISSGEVSLRTK